jgi:hypothetical protein
LNQIQVQLLLRAGANEKISENAENQIISAQRYRRSTRESESIIQQAWQDEC